MKYCVPSVLASTYFPGQPPAKYLQRRAGLTSVFGMGTGGPPPQSTPTRIVIRRLNHTNTKTNKCQVFFENFFNYKKVTINNANKRKSKPLYTDIIKAFDGIFCLRRIFREKYEQNVKGQEKSKKFSKKS